MENCRNKKGPRFPLLRAQRRADVSRGPGRQGSDARGTEVPGGAARCSWAVAGSAAASSRPPVSPAARRHGEKGAWAQEGAARGDQVTARRHRSSVSLLTWSVPYGPTETCAVPRVCACVSVWERVWRAVFRASRSLGHPPGLLERGAAVHQRPLFVRLPPQSPRSTTRTRVSTSPNAPAERPPPASKSPRDPRCPVGSGLAPCAT